MQTEARKYRHRKETPMLKRIATAAFLAAAALAVTAGPAAAGVDWH